ncbi:hypothetical protein Geu3261_0079_012 [Komagataeibacter europaeus NBRC 3261]|uniref:Uncharacterized protein n=1 Tax=Komagataeibacter europaeus NBRC 3261 TaxID=1234669 RepID=A0A0D6PZ10_KOMEU|nr:hypothetical protein Geu3261_0079_012 [Komagataeibacter europaeus NBRC 3261]
MTQFTAFSKDLNNLPKRGDDIEISWGPPPEKKICWANGNRPSSVADPSEGCPYPPDPGYIGKVTSILPLEEAPNGLHSVIVTSEP